MAVDYELIDTQEGLIRAAAALAAEGALAFDMECDNHIHHYGMRVCLLQFASPSHIFLIDAIAGLELAPLRAILEEPQIEKVMHDTDFDLRCLDAEYGWRPASLFDTKLAARLAGHKSFGIAALLLHYFRVHHAKEHQRADWSRRPLTASMLAYAAADVRHLLALRERLSSELASLGRLEWAREEFRRCERTRYEPDERPFFARVKGARELTDRQLALLQELAAERDAIARELNLPLFKVVSDERLLGLVRRLPGAQQHLEREKGLHPYLRGAGRERLARAIERGLSGPTLRWPRGKASGKRRFEDPSLLAALKQWRIQEAEAMRIEPDVLLPLAALRRLAAGEPLKKALEEEPVRGWQCSAVAPLLARFLEASRHRGKR